MFSDFGQLEPPYRPAIDAMFQRLAAEHLVARLWTGDPTLWHSSPDTQAKISQRLGWLTLPGTTDFEFTAWIRTLLDGPYTDIVIITGDAVGPIARLWQAISAPHAALPAVHVLDTIEPEIVWTTISRLVPSKTAVVCAALELSPHVAALSELVLDLLRREYELGPGQVFALTIPGSAVEEWLRRFVTPQVIPVQPDVNERFAAFSQLGFGLAAVYGLDVGSLRQVAEIAQRVHQEQMPNENPGVSLGVALGVLAQQGHDKLTFLASPALKPMAEWIALFVAGSLCKHRRGFVPIVDEPQAEAIAYGADRLFVYLCQTDCEDQLTAEHVTVLEAVGQPVVRLALSTSHSAVIEQIALWQIAVAVAGCIIGLNPFDEPDSAALQTVMKRQVSEPPRHHRLDAMSASSPELYSALRTAFAGEHASFVALVGYYTPTPEANAWLESIRGLLQRRGLATTVVYPLRDPLAATQLLHAGRPDGIVIAFVGELDTLESMDAGPIALSRVRDIRLAIDVAAWQRMGRSSLLIELGGDIAAGLECCSAALARFGD